MTWDSDRDIPDLTSRVAIVTGGNTGIGKEVVRQLAKHGAKVYMASRTESRAKAAIEELTKAHPEIKEKGGIEFLQLDLSDLKSAQEAAKKFLTKEKRLDILINNAGIMATPYELTKDGFEVQFQSNHLGHFAFTYPLIPLLVETSRDPNTSVRVVQVSSNGHGFASKDVRFDSAESVNRSFDSPWKRYGQSKLANILFAKELQRRLDEQGARVFSLSVHPGGVRTELTRGTGQSYPWARPLFKILNLFLMTPYKGAVTPLYAATSSDIVTNNWKGEYFEPVAHRTTPSKLAQDPQLAKDLWTLSEKLLTEKLGSLS